MEENRDGKKKRTIAFRVDDETYAQLAAFAAKGDREISWVVRKLVELGLPALPFLARGKKITTQIIIQPDPEGETDGEGV